MVPVDQIDHATAALSVTRWPRPPERILPTSLAERRVVGRPLVLPQVRTAQGPPVAAQPYTTVTHPASVRQVDGELAW